MNNIFVTFSLLTIVALTGCSSGGGQQSSGGGTTIPPITTNQDNSIPPWSSFFAQAQDPEDFDALVSEFETDENTEGTVEAEATEDKSQESSESKPSMNREVIQNIPITLAIEVGRASLKIRDLMRLTQGSVVELDRLAGEPLDIVVNDTVVAQGEVVLVNDRYGVRLTKVVSAADRIKNL